MTYHVVGHHGAHGDLLNVAVPVVEFHELHHLLPLHAARQQPVLATDLVDDEEGDVPGLDDGLPLVDEGGDVAVGVDADVPGADLLRVGADVRAPRAVLHPLLCQYQSHNLAYDSTVLLSNPALAN